MISAGAMTERITVLCANANRDAYGAETLTWTAEHTVWAQVRERGGREPLLADRPVMGVAYEIILRYSLYTAALTHLHRLVWRGKTLQIETVTPERFADRVVLRCLEIQN